MKLQTVENICKRAATLALLVGICLLYGKGIVPVYTILLLLFSGAIISSFFRTFSLIVKIILMLIISNLFA